jgi:hypothetical protein
MSPILQSRANASAIGYGAFFGAGAATSFESIATVTVGSGGTSSVDFTSIAGTYTHLQLRGIVRSTTSGTNIGDNVDLRLNSDSGSNYARHLLQGDGSSAATSTNTSGSLTRFTVAPRAGTTASTFTGFVMDILDYANTNKYKTIRTLSGVDTNGAGIVFFISGLWMSTSAVTSITLLPEANNFAQYSHFALYGIKSA